MSAIELAILNCKGGEQLTGSVHWQIKVLDVTKLAKDFVEMLFVNIL